MVSAFMNMHVGETVEIMTRKQLFTNLKLPRVLHYLNGLYGFAAKETWYSLTKAFDFDAMHQDVPIPF
jgi:hypothetical protein